MKSSNTPKPYKVMTNSDYSNGYAGWTAFDGVNTNGSICWSANANAGWIKFDFGENNQQKVGGVEISARLGTLGGAPKDFTIEISNDDNNWMTVRSLTEEVNWFSAESRRYMLAFNYLTRYIRITVTANNGRVRLDIGEIRFAYFPHIEKTLIFHNGRYKKWIPATRVFTIA